MLDENTMDEILYTAFMTSFKRQSALASYRICCHYRRPNYLFFNYGSFKASLGRSECREE